MMIRAASALHEARHIPGLAGESDVRPQWDAVARRIREEATDNWNDQVAVNRLEAKGGRFIRGRGRLVAPDRVVVGDAEITARAAIVLGGGAVGTELGLDADARFVTVDDTMRAGPGLWAAGDITGAGLFTHVAYYQADIATADILGKSPDPADYDALPRVTFTDPEVGSVGRSEDSARQEGIRVVTAFKPVAHTARGWLHAAGNDGFIKLVADSERGVLVGATSMGPHGGEVLGMLALAVHAQVPIAQMRSMMFAYPTFHKGIEDALNDLDI